MQFHLHLLEPLTDLHWSRLNSLLTENQLPSDIETQTLTKVEHDIKEFNSVIALLQSRRDAAVDYVKKHKSLFAPIRRLSNDVLVEIFMYVCSDTTLDTRCPNTTIPQRHLHWVCKHWRSLVNATPLLWSTLRIGLLYHIGGHFMSETKLSNLASLVLAKSGYCPLTIELADYHDDVHIMPVSTHLFQHADRWLSASILGGCRRFSSVSSFRQLKHLYLSNGNVKEEPFNKWWLSRQPDVDWQTIPAMPSLESLAIGKAFASHLPLPDFPWNQLRKLMLVNPLPLSQCASIISRCIQLQYVTLTFQRVEDTLPPVPIEFVSQTIISMSITALEQERWDKLFTLLQFPQLRTLNLDYCDLPAEATYPFIGHSLVSITNLSFKELYCPTEALLTLLRLFPNVTHFSLIKMRPFDKASGTLDDFFSKLRPADLSESKTLLPHLTHFDMQLPKLDHASAAFAFAEMVKSRVSENQLEQRLKFVRFSLKYDCFNHGLIPSLADLSKVGVVVRIEDECGFIL